MDDTPLVSAMARPMQREAIRRLVDGVISDVEKVQAAIFADMLKGAVSELKRNETLIAPALSGRKSRSLMLIGNFSLTNVSVVSAAFQDHVDLLDVLVPANLRSEQAFISYLSDVYQLPPCSTVLALRSALLSRVVRQTPGMILEGDREAWTGFPKGVRPLDGQPVGVVANTELLMFIVDASVTSAQLEILGLLRHLPVRVVLLSGSRDAVPPAGVTVCTVPDVGPAETLRVLMTDALNANPDFQVTPITTALAQHHLTIGVDPIPDIRRHLVYGLSARVDLVLAAEAPEGWDVVYHPHPNSGSTAVGCLTAAPEMQAAAMGAVAAHRLIAACHPFMTMLSNNIPLMMMVGKDQVAVEVDSNMTRYRASLAVVLKNVGKSFIKSQIQVLPEDQLTKLEKEFTNHLKAPGMDKLMSTTRYAELMDRKTAAQTKNTMYDRMVHTDSNVLSFISRVDLYLSELLSAVTRVTLAEVPASFGDAGMGVVRALQREGMDSAFPFISVVWGAISCDLERRSVSISGWEHAFSSAVCGLWGQVRHSEGRVLRAATIRACFWRAVAELTRLGLVRRQGERFVVNMAMVGMM